MKKLIFCMLLLSPYACADEVECYTPTKMIYHSKASQIRLEDGILSFYEIPSHKLIYTNGICIIKIDKKDNQDATKKR